jgi:hypothetical protein
LDDEVEHYISKALTQRLERTNGIVRQQTLSLASKTKQIWQRLGTNESYLTLGYQLLPLDLGAFSRAGLQLLARADLTSQPWAWRDIAVYPTLC